jgi:hypothetical protein
MIGRFLNYTNSGLLSSLWFLGHKDNTGIKDAVKIKYYLLPTKSECWGKGTQY